MVDKTSQIDLQERVQLNNLLDWLQNQGGFLHNHVHFVRDERMGISGFATEDIEANAVIATVPANACITTQHARDRIKELLRCSNNDDQLKAKEWIVLYLVLHNILISIDIKVQESGSDDEKVESERKRRKVEPDNRTKFLFHQDYVKLLPEQVLTPMHFNLEELSLLRNTPLFTHALRRRKETKESCIKAAKFVLQHLSERADEEEWINQSIQLMKIPDPIIQEQQKQTNLEDAEERKKWKDETGENLLWDEDERLWPLLKTWRWAETAHGSRAFPPTLLHSIDSAPVLLPCYDLFNHARHAKVTWTFVQKDLVNSIKQDCVTLTVHNPIEKDCQIFNSYGPKSNESLLASYGFVNETMEDDTVTIKLGRSNQSKQGESNTPINATKDENVDDQHYWQYGQPCPDSLLKQVIASLQDASNGVDNQFEDELIQETSHMTEEQRNRFDSIMAKGEALELIGEMASTKLNSLKAVKMDNIDLGVKVRPEVARNIRIYRAGQERVLKWAVKEAQRQEGEIMKQVDELMQER